MSYGCYALISLGNKISMIQEDESEYDKLKVDVKRAREFIEKNKLN